MRSHSGSPPHIDGRKEELLTLCVVRRVLADRGLLGCT